jgi:hypothetical protein
LLSADLALPGDGLLTYDDATGLQWLDLTATLGKSVNEVVGGFGGYRASGFRYASTVEVERLYMDAGANNIGDPLPGHVPNAILLEELMGITDSSSSQILSQGFAGVGEPGQGRVFSPFIIRYNWGAAFAVPGEVFTLNATGSVASYLVRSVPEPSGLALAISSLVILSVVMRRNRLDV